ncbi:nucleotidyltransferase family protein [Shewanella sp. A14]
MVSYWPEKKTAIGIKLIQVNDQIDSEFVLHVTSVFGLGCLYDFSLTANPKRNKSIFNARVSQKAWLIDYPNLFVTE